VCAWGFLASAHPTLQHAILAKYSVFLPTPAARDSVYTIADVANRVELVTIEQLTPVHTGGVHFTITGFYSAASSQLIANFHE
jgi:hypothetical protein